MSMSPLAEQKQDLGRPSADKDRGSHALRCIVSDIAIGRSFRSLCNLALAAHKTNLKPDIERVRVTNVAGFRSAQVATRATDVRVKLKWTR